MCYECHCLDTEFKVSDDSITDETFKKAAQGAGISIEEAKLNTYILLKGELQSKGIIPNDD